ncbi:hypothetical protein OIV83_000391 [Microbotryomycetes sp. JL201]|nr:hypothetical protein OIV83_000391 [Microbotryomycetes sp. JL201]
MTGNITDQIRWTSSNGNNGWLVLLLHPPPQLVSHLFDMLPPDQQRRKNAAHSSPGAALSLNEPRGQLDRRTSLPSHEGKASNHQSTRTEASQQASSGRASIDAIPDTVDSPELQSLRTGPLDSRSTVALNKIGQAQGVDADQDHDNAVSVSEQEGYEFMDEDEFSLHQEASETESESDSDDEDDEWVPGPSTVRSMKTVKSSRCATGNTNSGTMDQDVPAFGSKKKRLLKRKEARGMKSFDGHELWQDIPNWEDKEHLGATLFTLPGELIDFILGDSVLNLRDHTSLAATCRALRSCYYSRIKDLMPALGCVSAGLVDTSTLWQALIKQRPTPNNDVRKAPSYFMTESHKLALAKIWTGRIPENEMQVLWTKPEDMVERMDDGESDAQRLGKAESLSTKLSAEAVIGEQQANAPAKKTPGRKAKHNPRVNLAAIDNKHDDDSDLMEGAYVSSNDDSDDEDYADTSAAKRKVEAAKRQKLAALKRQERDKLKLEVARAKKFAKLESDWAKVVGKPVRSLAWEEAIDLVTTTRISKSKAISVYKVNEKMLSRIPCLLASNPHYKCAAAMRLYNAAMVESMALRCHGGPKAHGEVVKKREASAAKARATRQANASSRQRSRRHHWAYGWERMMFEPTSMLPLDENGPNLSSDGTPDAVLSAQSLTLVKPADAELAAPEGVLQASAATSSSRTGPAESDCSAVPHAFSELEDDEDLVELDDENDEDWQPGPSKPSKAKKSTKRKRIDIEAQQEQSEAGGRKKRVRVAKPQKVKPIKIKDLTGKEPWQDIPDWAGKQDLGCVLFKLPGELIDLILSSRTLNLRDHTSLAATCRRLRACYFSPVLIAKPGHANTVEPSVLWQALIMHRPPYNNNWDRAPNYHVTDRSLHKIWTGSTVVPDEMQVLWVKRNSAATTVPEVAVVAVQHKAVDVTGKSARMPPATETPHGFAKSQVDVDQNFFPSADDVDEDEDYAPNRKEKQKKTKAAGKKKQEQTSAKQASKIAKAAAQAEKEWAKILGKPVRSKQWDEAIDLVKSTKITKGKAIGELKVNERMLARIKCLFLRNPHGRNAPEMRLYNAAAVEAMAIRCHGGNFAHEDFLLRREAIAAQSQATRRANARANPPARHTSYGWSRYRGVRSPRYGAFY